MDNSKASIVDSVQALAENTTVKFDFSGWPGAVTAMTGILATAAAICFCRYMSR